MDTPSSVSPTICWSAVLVLTLQCRGTGTLSNLKLRAKGLTCPPKEVCITRRSKCSVFKGQRCKTGFVVCIASLVYHMIHPCPPDTVFTFQIVCSRWAEPTLRETRLRGKAMIQSGVNLLATQRRGIGSLGDS